MLAVISRKYFFVVVLLSSMITLSSCGLGFIGAVSGAKATTGATKALGDTMGKVIGAALNCTTLSIAASFAASIHLEMEQKDFNQFQQLIQDKHISKDGDFLYFLSPTESNDLRAWITKGYDSLSQGSELRKASVDDYMHIFATGMIQAHKDSPKAAQYKFFRVVDLGQSKTQVFALSVTLTGLSAETDPKSFKSYGECK